MSDINIYSTRTMLKALKFMKPVHTFFMSTFFGTVDTVTTEHIDVDIKKGKRKMAPFVAPRVGGKIIDREGFDTETFKVPKIAPERLITNDDISNRGMGEDIYSERTPEEREQDLLADDMMELDDTITRREEWMCRELLLNGSILIKGEGVEKIVDFKFTNKETLVGGALWTETTSDPYADLKRWRLAVIKASGKAPTVAVFSSDVVDDFTNHAKIQKILDLAKLNAGTIEPSIKDDAVTFVGKLPGLGLEIYSYDEWFLDDAGVEQPMMPAGTVLLGSKGMNKRIYGAVTQIENGSRVTIEGSRIPKSWVDEENDVRKLRISARPLPVPVDVDSWYVATVK